MTAAERRAGGLAEPRVRHREPVRVYWEDTDAGGIVYHANHLRWFERARTEWLRAAGVGQHALRERDGVVFVVLDARLRWRAPARLDDRLVATVAVREAGGASIVFAQRLERAASGDDGDHGDGDGRADPPASALISEADIRIGCVDAATLRPRRLPAPLAALLAPADPSDPR